MMPDTTAGTAGRPWDQQEGEPDDAFARFLVYLNIGPGRRLEDAFEASRSSRGKRGGRGRQRAYLAWILEAQRRHWRERAHAWDVHQLPQMYEAMLVNLVALKAAMTSKALEAIPRLVGRRPAGSASRCSSKGFPAAAAGGRRHRLPDTAAGKRSGAACHRPSRTPSALHTFTVPPPALARRVPSGLKQTL
jgi:hypothetical protein